MGVCAKKRGSIITEAAVMLPVYIIAVVTLVYIVRVCHTDIIVFSAVENEVQRRRFLRKWDRRQLLQGLKRAGLIFRGCREA